MTVRGTLPVQSVIGYSRHNRRPSTIAVDSTTASSLQAVLSVGRAVLCRRSKSNEADRFRQIRPGRVTAGPADDDGGRTDGVRCYRRVTGQQRRGRPAVTTRELRNELTTAKCCGGSVRPSGQRAAASNDEQLHTWIVSVPLGALSRLTSSCERKKRRLATTDKVVGNITSPSLSVRRR